MTDHDLMRWEDDGGTNARIAGTRLIGITPRRKSSCNAARPVRAVSDSTGRARAPVSDGILQVPESGRRERFPNQPPAED